MLKDFDSFTASLWTVGSGLSIYHFNDLLQIIKSLF